MTRRSAIAALIGGATLDPERLLWVPGKKLISIPGPSKGWIEECAFFTEEWQQTVRGTRYTVTMEDGRVVVDRIVPLLIAPFVRVSFIRTGNAETAGK